MKRILIITAIALLATSCKREVTNLEIYTSRNIYYINGLTVTNEVNNDTLTFKNMASLRNYIGNITANEIKSPSEQRRSSGEIKNY